MNEALDGIHMPPSHVQSKGAASVCSVPSGIAVKAHKMLFSKMAVAVVHFSSQYFSNEFSVSHCCRFAMSAACLKLFQMPSKMFVACLEEAVFGPPVVNSYRTHGEHPASHGCKFKQRFIIPLTQWHLHPGGRVHTGGRVP